MPTSSPRPKLNWKFFLLELPFWALLLVLIVAALISLSLRLALPQLSLAKQEVTSWLNEHLPFTLQVEQLEGQMQGINLSLAAQNIQLKSSENNFLKLDQAYLQLNSLTSLLAAKPLVKTLTLQGLEIWLEQTEDGWQLLNQPTSKNELAAANPEANKKQKLNLEELLSLLETLLAQGEVNLTNLKINLLALNEEQLSLEASSMGYNRYANGWQFNFELANSEAPEEKAQLLINLEGSKLNLNAAKIDAWFNLPQINLTDYQHLWPTSWPQEILQINGKISLEGWVNWHNKQVLGHLEAKNLELTGFKLNQQEQNFNFSQATLSFTSQAANLLKASWQIQNLSLNQHKFAELKGNYQLKNQQHQFQLAEISLNQLTPLAKELSAANPYLQKVITDLNPEGELTNLSFNLEEASKAWQLTANLKNVGVEAWEGAPKGKQVNGYLKVNNQGGEVVFVSPNLELGFPKLYPFSWQTSLAKGRVYWLLKEDKSFWVIGENLAIQLPSQHKSSSKNKASSQPIDVSGSFAFNGTPKEQRFYLNLGLAPTSVLAQQQLVPSKLLPQEVAAWLYNSLPTGEVTNTAFVFAGPVTNPRFELATSFSNTEFKFQPDWPSLKQATGWLNLENGWIKGQATQAKLGDAKLSQASFSTLPKFKQKNANQQQLLSLTTNLNSPTSSFTWLVNNSPLKNQIPEALHTWQFGGQLTGKLKLGLNLTNLEETPQVELTSQLSQASLNLSQLNLQVEQINGPLNFSLAEGFESKGLTGKLYGEQVKAKFLQPSKSLEFTTGLSRKSLGSYLGFDISPSILEGDTQIAGKLILEPLGELELTTNLYGLGYNFLPNFKKQPNTTKSLTAKINLPANNTPLTAELDEELSLTGVFLPKLAQLDFTGQFAQGQLLWPLENSPEIHTLKLDYLKLTTAEKPNTAGLTETAVKEASPKEDPLAELNPALLKPFKLNIKEIYLDANKLGSLEVELNPLPEGFSLQPLAIKLEESKFNGQLNWQQHQQTQVSGALTGKNLAPSYKALTNEDLPLTSDTHKFNFQLNWPASPLAFNLEDANGELSLKLTDGSFPKTSSGLSTTSQLFSLLNIDSLFRRLKLDFSDLSKKGITYTSINGSYKLEKGLLINTKSTEVKSSSSRLSLNGEINLLTQEIDQELKLVLPVAQSLPLAAVLVGAPQVGAGIWITQKIFGKSLDKISQATYQITGLLDEPKMELKKVF